MLVRFQPASTTNQTEREMEFRIELNVARKGAEPVWHFLMEDDHSPCIFDTEEDAIEVARGLFDQCRVVEVS